jgi:hypothetical protein
VIRHRLLPLLILACVLGPTRARGQGLPYTVVIVDWDADAKERQRRAYRSEASDHEVLFCVESWRLEPASKTGAPVDLIIITAVRRDEAGGSHRVHDVGERCIGKDGKPLPMFHTHSDGNCQFSPSDLIAMVARNAPYEGVQCGERHFIWGFAWQVRAVANWVDRERLAQRDSQP